MTGAQLRAWRLRLDLSQHGLAEALGVHPQTVSDWERDKTRIAHPKILRLALERLRERPP